jgi:hypothetical protein
MIYHYQTDWLWKIHVLVGGAITILKNISKWEGLSHISWGKK